MKTYRHPCALCCFVRVQLYSVCAASKASQFCRVTHLGFGRLDDRGRHGAAGLHAERQQREPPRRRRRHQREHVVLLLLLRRRARRREAGARQASAGAAVQRHHSAVQHLRHRKTCRTLLFGHASIRLNASAFDM